MESAEKEMFHVDDFIDSRKTDTYASWFFLLHRLPAVLQFKFETIIDQYTLFCDYESERYRVTGGSRLGDVWLTKDFTQKTGYEKRVNVADCSNFSNAA